MRTLIVEDELRIAADLERGLKAAGFLVETAGETALRTLPGPRGEPLLANWLQITVGPRPLRQVGAMSIANWPAPASGPAAMHKAPSRGGSRPG
ncbi:response regulator transcription factor [Paracoccus sp. P2]|mgnify:FL=1|uniref:response regulator transcription factor n=1 Tax=Paracoccus TaxID=265 RepID=UPI000463C999|nr:response regulator transcription factor [Paracoccus pantotrophus]MDF3853069.1 response regulator transcription factor [Paracoccus pantotrophus]SFN80393.1 hypothetical protein SAMN04244567_00251 [Paracoccus pantotrophus]